MKRVLTMSELWWPRRFGPSQGIRRTADRPSLGVAGARPPGVPTGLRLQLSGGHTGGEKPNFGERGTWHLPKLRHTSGPYSRPRRAAAPVLHRPPKCAPCDFYTPHVVRMPQLLKGVVWGNPRPPQGRAPGASETSAECERIVVAAPVWT